VLRAQVSDPTGAWLIRSDIQIAATPGVFLLAAFHEGGTFTQNVQGENAFDPHATVKPKVPLNIISSPQSGVWQKTGSNTFATTSLTIEYEVQTKPPAAPVFRFDITQYSGTIDNLTGEMQIDALITFFGLDGKQQNPDGTPGTDGVKFKATGVRIPLEILPNTLDSLPIPPIPQ
jgi:hypothetical protein